MTTVQPTIDELKAAYELRLELIEERKRANANAGLLEAHETSYGLLLGYGVGFYKDAQPYIAALETANAQLAEDNRLLTAELARARQQVGGAVNIIQYQLSQQQRTEHLLYGGNHED